MPKTGGGDLHNKCFVHIIHTHTPKVKDLVRKFRQENVVKSRNSQRELCFEFTFQLYQTCSVVQTQSVKAN